ncbi:unnamed protein product [Rotaria sordida]|uniref:Uncharacterized protein n=1 Tax=Rotaria sordida TaxID=392033 RepID=A0A814QHZ7_9BILA|nr:unnamed protein product [Rotaria sordida]CAF1138207.1 unnamed protein product [Rotaria sordida]CAF1366072.1 unnamed protein product [Rotaria sordida]
MNMGIAASLCLFFFEQLLIVKIQAREQCSYYKVNQTLATIQCSDDCCSFIATSAETACCSSISWSSLAIPFFIVASICFLVICFIYCRPLWKLCLCGYKCPCGNRTQVNSSTSATLNNNPIHVMTNEGLPDYETIIKDSTMKEITPPPYNFVASHPNDFGIEARVPSAPPRYLSRPNSAVMGISNTPIES